MRPPASRAARPVVAALFLLSGASGLIFETLWVRMLTTTFGATTFALSTVLTVFMGGLALGGFLAGRLADRLGSPSVALLLYGGLELLVGVYGLLFPAVLGELQLVHGQIWAHLSPGPVEFALIRFAIVSVVLLVPTTAMGATLPILARYYAHPAGVGRDAGTLYSVNLLGAVGGTFVAGFVLMPRIGLAATNHVACSINIFLCLAALGLHGLLGARPAHRGSARPGAPSSGSETTAEPISAGPASAGSSSLGEPGWRVDQWLVLGGAALSGLVAMVYQQVWTRVLALIVGSSVYAFALILIAFLLGLALGGALYSRRWARGPGQLANLATVHILVGTTVLGGYAFMDRLPSLFLVLARGGHISPGRIFLLKFLVCALVVLLPTIFMGMVFPATVSRVARAMTGVARTVGRVYSINTMGAIAGSFLGGFALIPLLGTKRTLGLMISLNLAMALAFTFRSGLGRRAILSRCVAVVGLLLVTCAGAARPWQPDAMTSGVFRLALFDPSRQRGRCPGPQAPISRLFARGAGRSQVLAAQRALGFRPDLETPCDQVVGKRLLAYREGVVATVSTWQVILEGVDPRTCFELLSLQVNGKADASSVAAFRRPAGRVCADFLGHPGRIRPALVSPRSDMETQLLSGLLGQLLYAGAFPPERALVIGWGSGVTVGSMAVTGARRVDAVELEPAVVRGARPFSRYNHRAADHPAVRLIEADGRNFLVASRGRYDIVVSEPSNPWMTGAASLFTREFFRLVRGRLRPDGVFIQWLQLYEISPENVASVVGTLRSVFPHVSLFRPRHTKADLLMVATPRPLRVDPSRLARRMGEPRMRAELERVRIRTPGDLLARFILGPAGVGRLVRGAPLNTDDNARVEFSAPRDLINYREHTPDRILAWMRQEARGIGELVDAPSARLLVDLTDAFLRLGELEAARATLGRTGSADPRVALRRRLLRLLSSAPRPGQAMGQLLAGLSPTDPLRAALGAARSPSGSLALLQSLVTLQPGPGTFAALGLALARTRHLTLALLFLAAARSVATLPAAVSWSLARLYRRLSLHRLAYQEALRAAKSQSQ